MFLSEILALCAAGCIALSGMLVNELNGRLNVVRLARLQMIATVIAATLVSVALGGWRSIAPWQFGSLALSGALGIMLASTTYFAAIYAIGARLTALLFSLTAPFALIMGYVLLGETISLRQAAGVGLVLSGIVLAIGITLPGHSKAGNSRAVPLNLKGIALGVITAFGQAAGGIAARPAMAAGAEPFTAMAIRSGVAALFFILLTFAPITALKDRRPLTGSITALALGSAFFGTFLGMSLLMAALSHGDVGIVSTLSSMTPVVILPMVWLRTGVAPPPRAWAGAALAVIGIGLISV